VTAKHRLLMFDCDGVLVDSELLGNRTLAGALAECGYPITPEECRRRFLGMALPSVFKAVGEERGFPLPDDIEARIRARDGETFGRELKAIDGIHHVLDILDGQRCVASSGSMDKMRFTLSLTGLWGRFAPHIFSARAVGRGTPAPDLFLYAARQMGFAPADCVVVEDSVNGVLAGQAAGMVVLGFTGGGHCGPEHEANLTRAGARAVFADMRRLPDVLAGLR
jgi:HAD superfamily hydrolase (TIGR01509 family)